MTTASQQIAYIKAKAGAVILGRFAQHSQSNAQARALELIHQERTHALSESETAEIARIEVIWAWVRSVRALSDTLEAQITGGSTIDMAAVEWPPFPEPEGESE